MREGTKAPQWFIITVMFFILFTLLMLKVLSAGKNSVKAKKCLLLPTMFDSTLPPLPMS